MYKINILRKFQLCNLIIILLFNSGKQNEYKYVPSQHLILVVDKDKKIK